MTPKGYRLATAHDLREGVEVLIPMIVSADKDATLTGEIEMSNFVQDGLLPDLALIRDEAAPDMDKATAESLHAALALACDIPQEDLHLPGMFGYARNRQESVVRLRTDLATALRERDEWRHGMREALDLGNGPDPTDILGDAGDHRVAVDRLRVDFAAVVRERDEARAAVTGEDVAALRAELIAETERAEKVINGQRAALCALRAQLATATEVARDYGREYGVLMGDLLACAEMLEIPHDGEHHGPVLAVMLDRARGGGR